MSNLQKRFAAICPVKSGSAKKSLANQKACLGQQLGGMTMPMILAAGLYALFMLTNAAASMTTVGGVPY